MTTVTDNEVIPMRLKSPETMRQIIQFVDSFFDDHLRTPSMREIERGTGLSRQTASSYLRAMAEQNMLEYDGDGIITAHIRQRVSAQTIALPIIGHVAAGTLTAAEEMREGFVEVPFSMLGGSDYFALRVYGESMIRAGIYDGDLVIVRKTHRATVGQIVVAIDDEGQTTLKRLAHDGQRYYLHPENAAFDDIYPNELRIQGVAELMFRDLKS